jgi:hypothetical protein
MLWVAFDVTCSIFHWSFKIGRCYFVHKPNLKGLFFSGPVLHVYDEILMDFSDQHDWARLLPETSRGSNILDAHKKCSVLVVKWHLVNFGNHILLEGEWFIVSMTWLRAHFYL